MSERSLAIYKAQAYRNYEGLDVEEDYTNDGIYKAYPVFSISTNNGRDIVSPEGFIDFMTSDTVLDELDIDDIEADGDTVTFICRNSWNWYSDGEDPFEGDAFWNGLHQYITSWVDMWE